MVHDLGLREKAHSGAGQVVGVLLVASLLAVVLGYIQGRSWSAASVVLALLVIIFAMWSLWELNPA